MRLRKICATVRHVADLWSQRPKAANEVQTLEHCTTRSMVKISACRKALQLPEILEQIISHLPGRNILNHAQKVSKLWKDVISTSPLVQKRLGRRPQTAHVSAPTATSTWSRPSNLPYAVADMLSSGVPIYSGSYQINIVFPKLLTDQLIRDRYPAIQHAVSDVVSLRTLARIHFVRLQSSANANERFSWQGMQLTEPPITTVWIEVKAPIKHGEEREVGQIQAALRESHGVTIGAVIDVIDRIIARPAHQQFTCAMDVWVCFVADGVEQSHWFENRQISATS
jgi:hypothetical protein